MARFFTYSWRYAETRKEPEGAPLAHAAGSKFSARGIEPGDFVYITAVHHGRLYLLGRLEVGAIVDKDEARRLFGAEPYDAPEHLVARSCSPAQLAEVPLALVKELRFAGGSRLAFRDDNTLDPQTLRSIRELDAESAARLDALTGEMALFVPPGQQAG